MGIIDSSVTADLAPELKQELIRGELAAEALGLAGQRAIARDTERRPYHHVDGLGECKMRIHPDLYWRMVALYGPRCWHDPAFRESVLKKNPEARVKSRSRKTSLRVDGLKQSTATSKGGLHIAYR